MLSRNRGVYVAVKRSVMMLREGPNKHVYFRAAVNAGGSTFLTLEAGDRQPVGVNDVSPV